MKFKHLNLSCAILVIIFCVSFATVSSPQPEERIRTAVAEAASIGKAPHHDQAAVKNLTVNIPLNAEIISIKAYFAYLPWGEGQSDYQPTTYVEAPIVGLDGQGYAEWPHSWASAHLIERGSTSNSQYVTVKFRSWKHDNSRKSKLEVKYTLP